MRALLSRGTRPTLGPVNALGRSSTNSTVRRTTFPILRRQLTFCDAFTILLGPVLTTAFLIETTRKERRRQAWDKIIAEVEAATEALRQREIDAWTRLQHRSVKHGSSYQRRLYSTATSAAIKVVDEAETDFGNVTGDENKSDDGDDRDIRPSFREVSETDIKVTRDWAHLIAMRLALRMLIDLRFETISSTESNQTLRLDSRDFPQSTDELIKRLSTVSALMRNISRPTVAFEEYGRAFHSESRRLLDLRVEELVNAFSFGHLSLTDLVIGYANAVSATSNSPSTRSLQSLMFTLYTTGRTRMASSVAEAIFEGAQILSDEEVSSMLNFYARNKEIGMVDKFLKRLTRRDSFPRSRTRWKMAKVLGMNLPIPNSAHPTTFPATMEQLVRTRLRCNQRRIAECYHLLLFDRYVLSRANISVNRSFMYHDAEFGNWNLGKKWLRQTITDAACAVHNGLSEEELSKVIFAMLDLCVSCNQVQEYQHILDATVSAGIELASVNSTGLIKHKPRTQDIRRDWKERELASMPGTQTDDQNLLDKVIHFQRLLAERDPTLTQYVGVTDPLRLDEMEISEEVQMRSSQAKRTGAAIKIVKEDRRHYWKSFNVEEPSPNSSNEVQNAVLVKPRCDSKDLERAEGRFVSPRGVLAQPSIRRVNSNNPTTQSQPLPMKDLPEVSQDEEEADEGYCSDSTTESLSPPLAIRPPPSPRPSKPSNRVGVSIPPSDDWSELFGASQRYYAVG